MKARKNIESGYAVSQNCRLVGYVSNPIDCRELPMFDTCGGNFKVFKGNEKVYDSRLRFRCKKIRKNMIEMHLGTILEENLKENRVFLNQWRDVI